MGSLVNLASLTSQIIKLQVQQETLSQERKVGRNQGRHLTLTFGLHMHTHTHTSLHTQSHEPGHTCENTYTHPKQIQKHKKPYNQRKKTDLKYNDSAAWKVKGRRRTSNMPPVIRREWSCQRRTEEWDCHPEERRAMHNYREVSSQRQ